MEKSKEEIQADAYKDVQVSLEGLLQERRVTPESVQALSIQLESKIFELRIIAQRKLEPRYHTYCGTKVKDAVHMDIYFCPYCSVNCESEYTHL